MAKIKKAESKNKEIKPRKINSGPLRNKERTIKKIIAAVGIVLQKYGYPGLSTVNIAKEAELDRRLIYTYFGSTDHLIEAYIKEKDFWKSGVKTMSNIVKKDAGNGKTTEINKLIQVQFDNLLKDKEQQKIIHWELGEKNKILRKISDEREEVCEEFLTILDENFQNSTIDIRSLLALQIGGIYYLSLHAKSNGGSFFGIDLNENEGKMRISKCIQNTLEMADDVLKINK